MGNAANNSGESATSAWVVTTSSINQSGRRTCNAHWLMRVYASRWMGTSASPTPDINSVGAMRNSNTHGEELQVVLFVSHKSDDVVDLDCASNQF